MAGMNPTARSFPLGQTRGATPSQTRRRFHLSWEDWLTFAPVVVAYLAIAYVIQRAGWVNDLPQVAPTIVAGLAMGLLLARVRTHALALHPVALVVGFVVVIGMVQLYADGVSVGARLVDLRDRMLDWWAIVRNGEISNDNLPFVLLVHSIAYLAAYASSWSIFRWHNAWLALIPASFVMISTLSFQDNEPVAAFVVFLVAAMIIVSRAYLQKSQRRWTREGVEFPDFISLNVLVVTLILASVFVTLAWRVPIANEQSTASSVVNKLVEPLSPFEDDVVRLFNSVRTGKGSGFHSFGDTLPLQGQVELGSKTVLKVEAPAPGLIRATSYDRYTGVGWQASDRDSERREGLEFLEGQSADDYQGRERTLISVEVIDNESTLLSLGIPVGTNLKAIVDTPENAQDIERLRSARKLDRGDRYNMVGSVSVASADELRESGRDYPEWVTERYLQLPDELPERVAQRTSEIVGGTSSPYDAAAAIQEYLRTMPYTTEVPSTPVGRDAVDYLLNDLQRGYFDYQATAMAVMLRTQGIPTRLAVGFALDPEAYENGQFTVRKNNAFAWVEVFFPEYGWVTFNPTSDLPPGGAGALGGSDVSFDPSEIPPGIVNNPELSDLFNMGDFGLPQGGASAPLAEEPVDQSQPPWWILEWAAGIAAVLLAVAIAGWAWWMWGLRGLEGRVRQWAAIQRLARLAKLPVDGHATPMEWGQRLGREIHAEPEALLLAGAYQEVRYAPEGRTRISDEDADSAFRVVRMALIRRILRLKPRADEPAAPEAAHAG